MKQAGETRKDGKKDIKWASCFQFYYSFALWVFKIE